MIDIDMSKYTQLYTKDAVKLMRELIQKPPTHNGRTPLQTSALAMGFCSMKRHGRTNGANEKYLSILSYLVRIPTALIFPEQTITDALNTALSCLEADAAAERAAVHDFARRY